MQRKNKDNEKQLTSAQARFSDLPDEVIREIFKFSEPEFILRSFSLVCRRFFNISTNDSLWHFKLEEYFPFSEIPEKNNQSPLTVFKSNRTSKKTSKGYYEIRHLFSYLAKGEISKLIESKEINLETFTKIKDPADKSLLDHAILLKQQPVLDHVYELAKRVEKETPELREMTIFFWAVLSNQKDEVVRLIQKGANVNEGVYPGTPLCLATEHGNLEMVKLLLDQGAEINQARNRDNKTPLLIASKKGDLEMVKLLLKKGADINKANNSKATPLFFALKHNHLEVVDALLIATGINVNQVCSMDDSTPLLIAAQNGRLEVVQKLLKVEGIQVNQANNNGTTPLFAAAINGQLGVVDELLKAKAKLDKVDFTFIDLFGKKYKTPLFELKPGETLKEGILFLKPNSQTLSYPNLIINVSIIFALEKTYQHLDYERQDDKKALAIRNLIDLIYTDPEKSFSEHVMTWRNRSTSHINSATNQSIISAHSNIASGAAKKIVAPIAGLVGLFSASHSKVLEKKAKADTEVLIEDLEAHSKLWSGNSPAQENTASSMQLKNTNGGE